MKEEETSQTVVTNSILITDTIKTKQDRGVMTFDILNIFIQMMILKEGEK